MVRFSPLNVPVKLLVLLPIGTNPAPELMAALVAQISAGFIHGTG